MRRKKILYADRKDGEGRTRLHYHAENGDLKRVIQCIQNVTDEKGYVTLQDRRGLTALHCAAQKDDLDLRIIEFLIMQVTDKKAYVTTPDQTGRTALHYAARTGDPRVVELLIKHAITINDDNECTPLQPVAKTDDPMAVESLHRQERNRFVTLQDESGQTSLHYAASKGYPKVVKQLINEAMDKNAFVITHDKRLKTALHYATEHSSLEVIEQLMYVAGNKHVYIAKEDDNKCSALDYAIQRDDLVVFKKLIWPYTNLFMEVLSNSILLHKATKHNASSLVLFLLGVQMIDPKFEDSKLTAWDIACAPGEERWKAVAAFILKEADHDSWSQQVHLPIPCMNTNDMGQVYKALYNIAFNMQIDITIDWKRLLNMDRDTKLIETLADILPQIRREFHENQEAPKHFMRSREPSCIIQTLDYSRQEGRKLYDFISLVIPYIHINNWSIVEKRETEWKDQVKELKFFASNDRIFLEGHMPNTLDEYCSPALSPEILTSRNEDQVLWRYEKKKPIVKSCADNQQEAQAFLDSVWTIVAAYMRKLRYPRPKRQQSVRKPVNAVFVSQACIWQIGNQVLAPQPQSSYPDLPNKTWDGLKQCYPSIFIALFLGELVDRFDTPKPGGETLLKVYENALVFISQDVNEYTKSVLIEDIDLEQENALFQQISDLREELSMIKSVLSQQEAVWNEYTSHIWPTQLPGQQPNRNSSTKRTEDPDKEMAESVIPRQLLRTRAKFSKYNRRIMKLEEDAERVERNISTKLDLKQKHATMREAHSAAMLSATVFGFTIITVIFAPLSFVVALFALPIDKFNEGKDGNDKDGVYSSNYIGKWSVAAELASIVITLGAMWAALRFVGIHIWGKKGIRDYVRQKAQEIQTTESNYDNDTVDV